MTGTPVTKSRRTNYWEPIFTVDALGPFQSFDWNTGHVTGVKRCICYAETLKELQAVRNLPVIRNIGFLECDFFGHFDSNKLTFKDCTFDTCDLGRCFWKDVKFQNCTFKQCSLTQTTFDSCQFVHCIWEKIGISGTETVIKDCLFSNPREFISAAYTNLDERVLSQQSGDNRRPSYQQMRLEQSKLKVARAVLTSMEQHGDDSGYYEAVKTYLNQTIIAKLAQIEDSEVAKPRIVINAAKRGFLLLELAILNASGAINSWGGSIAKPAIVGLGLALFFAVTYWIFSIESSLTGSLIASFDITTLVGYTKHATKDSSLATQLVYLVNMALGLWWYAIFVPTVINRISRVRT